MSRQEKLLERSSSTQEGLKLGIFLSAALLIKQFVDLIKRQSARSVQVKKPRLKNETAHAAKLDAATNIVLCAK